MLEERLRGETGGRTAAVVRIANIARADPELAAAEAEDRRLREDTIGLRLIALTPSISPNLENPFCGKQPIFLILNLIWQHLHLHAMVCLERGQAVSLQHNALPSIVTKGILAAIVKKQSSAMIVLGESYMSLDSGNSIANKPYF